jgi:hypothetical protein
MTERWRHPLNEALDMADAFREGVPLGWQRAFVALADAYRDVLADHASLQDELVALRRGDEPMRRDVWMDAALAEPPAHELDLSLDYESLTPRVYRARQTRDGMEITRSNDWPAPENDAGPDWTYPPLPDIDTAHDNRRARRALMIACALALVVAGLVRFL